ncbi:DUF542 domain-containing protein [Terrisporobacter sp.]
MKNINRDLSLGECVVIYPPIANKFNKMQLDYYCGGDKNLRDALNEKGIDIDKFIEDVNVELEEFEFDNIMYINWKKKSSGELINHIVNTHHVKTLELLREIDPLLLKVFRVHYNHSPQSLKRIYRLFQSLKCRLEEHIIKEEVVLFPKMLEFNDNLVDDENKLSQRDNINNKEGKAKLREEMKDLMFEHKIKDELKVFKEEHKVRSEMKDRKHEHDTIKYILKELAEITGNYTAPKWACDSLKLLYVKMQELEKELFIYMHEESNILFKRY